MKLYDEYKQVVDFDIAHDIDRILISCSGGADSAILFYILCDYLQKQNRTNVTVDMVSFSNDVKWRWNGRKAADIINYIIDKLAFKQFDTHHVHYIPVQESKYWHPVQRKFFQEFPNALVITGETCNPKPDAENKYLNDVELAALQKRALPERNIDSPNIKQIYSEHHHKKYTSRFFAPFTHVDKRFVASMYSEYNVKDMFFLTRSCENVPPSADGYYKEFENTPCQKCWWCLERKWAFGEF